MVQVLITGASGYLGTLLIRDLKDLPSEVNLILTYYRHRISYQHLNSIVVQFDLNSPTSILSHLDPNSPLLVIHLACSVSNDIGKAYRIDYLGTEKLIASINSVMLNNTYFIFASSEAVLKPDNYGLVKEMVEKLLESNCSSGFYSKSIRIPFIRDRDSGEYYDILGEDFADLFSNAIQINLVLEALKCCNRPLLTLLSSVGPLYLKYDSPDRLH